MARPQNLQTIRLLLEQADPQAGFLAGALWHSIDHQPAPSKTDELRRLVDRYLADRGLTVPDAPEVTSEEIGQMMADLWRAEFGKEPEPDAVAEFGDIARTAGFKEYHLPEQIQVLIRVSAWLKAQGRSDEEIWNLLHS